MKRFLIIIGLFIVLGCSSSPKVQTPSDLSNTNTQAQLERGLKALEKEDYATAEKIFDALLVQKPASQADLVILYNSGVANEGLGNCAKASERYRKVVQASAGRFKKIEAEAYFRLSFAYECTGEDKKAISALFDAKKRGTYLPPEVSNAELPARLATAYARIGQRPNALKYFKEAGNGLKSSLASGGSTTKMQTEFAAKTLYAMGQLSSKQRRLSDDPKAFLNSLSMQQPYLLQATEMGVNPHSQNAADDLIFAYENLLKVKPSDPTQVRPFLQLALKDIAEIKRIRLPGRGALVDQVFAKIEVQESQIRRLLMAQPETTPLTAEARKREGLKREGRVVGPSVLEQGKKQKK